MIDTIFQNFFSIMGGAETVYTLFGLSFIFLLWYTLFGDFF